MLIPVVFHYLFLIFNNFSVLRHSSISTKPRLNKELLYKC